MFYYHFANREGYIFFDHQLIGEERESLEIQYGKIIACYNLEREVSHV